MRRFDDLCTDILYEDKSPAVRAASEQGLTAYSFKWNGAHAQTIHSVQAI